jgi:citrate lyase subunit beta/citryl-CoA lyase
MAARPDRPIRPRRSALYMPGANARALDKARAIPADVMLLDLEDSVAPEAKENGRVQVHDALRAGGYGQREMVVRINGLETAWGEGDIKAAVAAAPAAVLLPKVSSAADVEQAERAMTALGADPGIQLWAMMETPLAMLNAQSIAAIARQPGSRLACLVMGTNDLAKETRAELVPERQPMMPWLMTCVAAARAYGLEILDGVFNNFRDVSGLRREAEQGKEMGMDGKTVIHPDQVVPCNQIFAPSTTELKSAQRIIDAFARPENAGKGVISVDGRMVELLHREMAARAMAIAAAIAARERGGVG